MVECEGTEPELKALPSGCYCSGFSSFPPLPPSGGAKRIRELLTSFFTRPCLSLLPRFPWGTFWALPSQGLFSELFSSYGPISDSYLARSSASHRAAVGPFGAHVTSPGFEPLELQVQDL